MADPANNDTPPKNSQPEQDVTKDKPRPFTIFRIETAKTAAVLKESTDARRSVDDKVTNLARGHAAALEKLEKSLKEAGEQRIAVRKESVDKLSTEVGSAEKKIAELRQQLQDEGKKLARSQEALGTAKAELHGESSKIAKENKITRNAKLKEHSVESSAARKERKAVYKSTRKALRRERWNTFKRTTKEAVAFGPDLVFRFGKAAHHAASEVVHVFGRSAKKAQEGYNKPTPFSIKRDNKPDAPKP